MNTAGEIVVTGAWILGVLTLVVMAFLPVLQALAETAGLRGGSDDEPVGPALDARPYAELGQRWVQPAGVVTVPAQRAATEEHVSC